MYMNCVRRTGLEGRRAEQHKDIKNSSNKKLATWNKPIIHTVLLSLIVILLVGILCLLLAQFARDTTCTTGAIAQWTNDIVSKVNSNVTGSLPDFNEWASGNNTNFTELDKQILQTTRDSAQKLINIVTTLSNLQDTSTSTAGVADDILLIAQELLVLHNDSTALPTSCKEIKERQPNSPSGLYLLANTYTAYCNMGTLCGSGGGWTRLAYLDMSDATQNCPSGFRLYQSGGVRACGRNSSSGSGCVSVQFPSNGISYSQICGRVTGYQYSSPIAFFAGSNDINSYYVDGVSITHGSPRQHVWTLANGVTDTYFFLHPGLICPCSAGGSHAVPSFVGNHYFCESGNNAPDWIDILYTSDPLWDGQGCGSYESPCCNVTGIPLFHRDYGSNTTTDYIELRVCGSGGLSSVEDSPVSFYEIYVK
uniref:Fibrinogen C-terminal domain-containing protein n=1 Tax=Amphimedon queenslandica TaxID=400682 RepID=A0A1X7TD46_AMPQE